MARPTFTDYLHDRIGARGKARGKAPSTSALKLLQLLKVEDGTVTPIRTALDAYLQLPADIDDFREELDRWIDRPPEADPHAVVLVESTDTGKRSEEAEKIANRLVELAVAGSYRWLRRRWHEGFGGGEAGVARRTKAVEYLKAAGLKQQCEIDAAAEDLEIPDDCFDLDPQARREWLEARKARRAQGGDA